MTSDFDHSASPHLPFSSLPGYDDDCSTPEVLDVMKRDRFELLSAYLDGEVTADERRQVETWLDQDATVQQLYQRLLRLRQGCSSLPAPSPDVNLNYFVDGVMGRIERRSRRRFWVGGGAIAAIAIGAISTVWFGPESRFPQFARTTSDSTTQIALNPLATDSDEVLHLALDRPILEIPKASNKSHLKHNQTSPSFYESKDDVR